MVELLYHIVYSVRYVSSFMVRRSVVLVRFVVCIPFGICTFLFSCFMHGKGCSSSVKQPVSVFMFMQCKASHFCFHVVCIVKQRKAV